MTAAARAARAGISSAHGQCQFVMVTTSQCKLNPYNGNGLLIDGVSRTIPDGGIALAPFGASLSRYIYAYWTGTAIALEASTTGHEWSSAYVGVRTKIGDASRTLVGWAQMSASNLFQDTNLIRFVASWFNRRHRRLYNQSFANCSSTSVVNISNNYLNFFTWFDSTVFSSYDIPIDVPDNGTGNTYLNLDGTTYTSSYSYAQGAIGNWFDGQSGNMGRELLSEGTHYFGVSGSVTTGVMIIIGSGTHSVEVDI